MPRYFLTGWVQMGAVTPGRAPRTAASAVEGVSDVSGRESGAVVETDPQRRGACSCCGDPSARPICEACVQKACETGWSLIKDSELTVGDRGRQDGGEGLPTGVLLPEHLSDLGRSGLTEEDALEAGIRSVSAQEITDLVGFPVSSSGYVIPYPGTDAMRVRLDAVCDLPEGGATRYVSPMGSLSRLYIPAGVREGLSSDPTCWLVLTHNEKKALALRKLGLSAVAFPGVWGWRSERGDGGVVQDLQNLRPLLHDRSAVIVFDSDAREGLEVARAAAALVAWLRDEAKAKPSWSFPSRDSFGTHRGVDDILVNDGREAASDLVQCATEPQDPAAFVLRCLLESTSPEDARPFVGTPLFERILAALRQIPWDFQSALAEEARNSLKLTLQDRAALTAGLRNEIEGAWEEEANASLQFGDPEPWGHRVDGAELLGELATTLRRFVVLPASGAEACALWTVFTYCLAAFDIAPRLLIRSPDLECGKTTLMTVLAALVLRPLLASNAAAAVIFRVIEASRPALLLDEFDNAEAGKKKELLGILNSGHTRAGAWVLRCGGQGHSPRKFSTWTPIAFAAIGRLHRTLESRSITVRMFRRREDEAIASFREDRLSADLEPLRRKCARWARDHLEEVGQTDPEIPEGLTNRAADNWRPLLAIADSAGGEWPLLARRAAASLSGRPEVEDQTLGIRLLADLRGIFARRGADRLSTEDILRELKGIEEPPWSEDGRARKPLNPHRLSALLRPYDIAPTTIRPAKGPRAKGYKLKDFQDAFQRYLP